MNHGDVLSHNLEGERVLVDGYLESQGLSQTYLLNKHSGLELTGADTCKVFTTKWRRCCGAVEIVVPRKKFVHAPSKYRSIEDCVDGYLTASTCEPELLGVQATGTTYQMLQIPIERLSF